MLYVELHRASVAAAAVFALSSRAAAVVTRKMDGISLYAHVCIERVHPSVNNKRRYLIFSE